MDRYRWLQGFLLAEVIFLFTYIKTEEIVCHDKETLRCSDYYYYYYYYCYYYYYIIIIIFHKYYTYSNILIIGIQVLF